MASISRTWFHSESKPDVTIRNAKVELYIDGIFKEEMPWKEYSYWKSSRWLGEDRGGWVTDTLYISNTVPQPGQTVKIVASTPEYGTASAEDKIPSKTEIKGLRIIPRKEATGQRRYPCRWRWEYLLHRRKRCTYLSNHFPRYPG